MKLVRVLREELVDGFDGPAIAARVLTWPLPLGTALRLRTQLLRRCGVDIGAGTTLAGPITITGGRGASARLHLGRVCYVNVGCVFDASDEIRIGDGVAIGQQVLMTTSSHEWGHPQRRGGALTNHPIRVGDGAWIAARAVLLPGVEVGAGAIVTAGAVVTRSIPPHTMAGGVPARPIRELDPSLPARP